MPAGLHFSLKFLILSAVVVLLSACSRDNPLNIPDPFIEPEEPYCLNNGPYAYFTLIEAVSVSNMADALPAFYPFGYEGKTAYLTAPYLINKAEITPQQLTDSIDVLDPESGEFVKFLLVNEKVLQADLINNISPAQYAELETYVPQAKSLDITINYPLGGEMADDQITDEIVSVSADLVYGQNSVTIKTTSSIKVPRTFVDCENPLTQEELESEDFTDEDRYKFILYTQNFKIDINRNNLNSFVSSELDSSVALSENDRLGKVVAVNDRFLVLGSPEEDTLARGIFNVSQGLTQNEDSPDSGAVYIYSKDDNDAWSLHTTIKSSNSESGDMFGAAVSLYDNTLVVSALGESSIASGVNLTAADETDNLKLNNSATNSGAVFVFQFDEQTDLWSETYYIKPNVNTVSDAKYAKGFGSQIALYKNKLLISAPLEDSDNGNFSNSDQPDSGAVYVYNNSSGTWVYKNVLKAFNPGAGDKFGSSIALDDNFYFVGAPFEDHSNRSITNKITTIEFPDGSPFENNTRSDSGAVYVYQHSLNDDVTLITTHLKSSNSDTNDYFGSSLAILDGSLFVGAIGEDSSGRGLNRDMSKNDLLDSGAVYNFVYNNENLVWTENAYIKANDSQREASFGKFIVADNRNLFISAPLHDNLTLPDAGKAYYYEVIGSNIIQELMFQSVGDNASMRFGSAMSLKGRNFILGASGTIQQSTGLDEPFAGKVFTFQ